MEEIRCSMCGKPNPADESICQHCGARLTPVKPSNAGKFTGGLSWLDAFRVETGDSGNESPAPEVPAQAADIPSSVPEGGDAPDWLQRIRERTDSGHEDEAEIENEAEDEGEQEIYFNDQDMDVDQKDEGDVPDWLRNLKEDAAAVPDQSREEEIPHWAESLKSWNGEPDQQAPGAEAEGSGFEDRAPKVTEWLNRILPGDETVIPKLEKEEFIDDTATSAVLDDVDIEDWHEKSATLSSITESSSEHEEVPSWLQGDAEPSEGQSGEDVSGNLLEWLQDLDEKEGGKQKARYWMGDVDTGDLPKQSNLDPRFVDKEEESIPVFDPYATDDSGKNGATQFFSEEELEEEESPASKESPSHTMHFDQSEGEEIPEWMKDQPGDETIGKPIHTVALSGLDDQDLGMDHPEEQIPHSVNEAPENDLPKRTTAPKMTAALSELDEEIFGADAVGLPDWMREIEEVKTPPGSGTPIMTAALSGLDDEDLGMDLPEDEIPPWVKNIEESSPPTKKKPPIMTAALSGLDEEEIDAGDEAVPDWLQDVEETALPPKKQTPIMTAALSGLDEEEIDAGDEAVPDWLQDIEKVALPPKKGKSLMTAALSGLDEEESNAGDEAVPDWLQDIEKIALPPKKQTPIMTAALSGLDEEDTGTPEKEIPPWMQEIEEAASQPGVGTPLMTAALSGLDDEDLGMDLPEDEIPPWLQDIEEAALPPKKGKSLMTAALSGLDEEDTGTPEKEIPPWMQEIEEAASKPKAATPIMTASLNDLDEEEVGPPEDDVPLWMQDTEEVTPPQRTATPLMTAALSGLDEEEIGAVDDDVPDWMKNLQQSAEQPLQTAELGQTETVSFPNQEPIERDARTSQPQMTAFINELQDDVDKTALAPPEEQDTPKAVFTTEKLEEFEDADDGESVLGILSTDDETPDWLTTIAENGITDNEQDVERAEYATKQVDTKQPGITAFLEEAGIPDWLNEMQPDDSETQASKNPAFTYEAELPTAEDIDHPHPFAGDDLPNWLSPEVWQADGTKEKVEAEEPTEQTQASGVEGIQWELEGLERGELPTWLQQIKPGQLVKRKPHPTITGEAEIQSEKVGPLAGLMGVLPARNMVMMYRKPPVYSDQINLTERQSNRMQILARMIESEAKNKPLKVGIEKIPFNLMRIIFAAILILVMMIPFSGIIPMPTDLPFVANDPVVAFYNQVEQFPPNSSVLLVMDFESGYTAEMRSTLDGLIARLYEKDINIAMISTLPTGPVLGEEIAQDIWVKYYNAHTQVNVAEYETRVINLGYLPGGSAAMLQFVRYPRQSVQYGFRYEKDPVSVWESQVLSSIQSTNDFAGVVVVTDSPNVSRNWIEQSTLYSLNNILFITSAQTYPLILPYWQSGQVKGLVAGIYQGYTYRALLNQSAGLSAKWYSYQFGMNLVTLVVVLLTIIFLIRNAIPGTKTTR